MFSENVKELRVLNNLTQKQLAERIGVTRECIGLIERGKREPYLRTAIKLADALEVEIQDLV